MIFAIKHGGKNKMLEIDFIDSLLIVFSKDKILKRYHFKMIKRILPSDIYDEYFIEFRDEKVSMQCISIYQS